MRCFQEVDANQHRFLPDISESSRLFFCLSERVQLRALEDFLAEQASLHGIHTHSGSPNKGGNYKDAELWERVPSRRCLAGLELQLQQANAPGTKLCQTLPRK